MQLSNESTSSRWLIMALAWALIGGVIVTHTRAVRDYLAIAGGLGVRGQGVAVTPLRATFPAFAADAQTWVRHALSLAEGNDLRLRHTAIDNGLVGREVHWNSAWAWAIVASARLEQWATGAPLTEAMERSVVWFSSLVLWLLIVVVSGLAAWRAGAAAGVFVGVGMLGHPRVFEGFFPSYVDHHGLLVVSALGLVLGVVFMGAGWWQAGNHGSHATLLPESVRQARQGAILSAVSGALGVWVSAASAIPPIALVGAAGAAAILLGGRAAGRSGAQFDAESWRLWGRVGAFASFVFYLIEYFPGYLALRLESNHPFYALAWLGGGYLLAALGEGWSAPAGYFQKRWKQLVWPALAVGVAPLTIAVGGARVFGVLDPFMANLHHSIQEFLPLWTTIPLMGWPAVVSVFGLENIPLAVGVVTLGVLRGKSPLLLWFATMATALFAAMAWRQSRWLLNASAPHLVLVLVLIAFFAVRRAAWVRWGAVAFAACLLFSFAGYTRLAGVRADVAARKVSPKDAQQALMRDIAAVLRASSPKGEMVVLTSPNSSTGVGYYGRFKTLGTLYWENGAGLKAAAAIFSAGSPEEAAGLARRHGVTHVAMISEEHFLEQYFRLLHPEKSLEEFKKSFGYQLMVNRVVPTWLQMLPYQTPDDLLPLKITVLLFKVAFEQSPADALYHIALAKIATGAVAEAEVDLETLTQKSPESYQPWLRKGELLFSRREWAGATGALLSGIRMAPAGERLGLYATTAGNLYREKQAALAVRVYRAALTEGFNSNLAAYLAFALATSDDDAVRNGREAQEIAERIVHAEPENAVALNALAAAQAENGRFDAAVATMERALAFAAKKGDAAIHQVSGQRLALFKAGKPLRQ